MEGNKACTIAIVFVLISVALVAGQTYNIPAVSFNAHYNSVCPPDTHLDAVKTELSNKITDILAAKFGCGGYGWRQIAYLNMTDPNQTCPQQWRMYEQDTVRACGRQETTTASCDSVKFSSNGYVYTEVCGRITGYQHGNPDASFESEWPLIPGNEINEPYLDGVSITYGNPRKHIWSLYGGNGYRCCLTEHINFTKSLNFIGNNSFCDNGNGPSEPVLTIDPLWDGVSGCDSSPTCCAPHSGPWFHTTLMAPTIGDIEIRICGDHHSADEDTPVDMIDIYIK